MVEKKIPHLEYGQKCKQIQDYARFAQKRQTWCWQENSINWENEGGDLMEYICLYSDRRFYPETVNPAAAMSKAELVRSIEHFPDEAPVFFSNGTYCWAIRNEPYIAKKR